MTRVLVRSLLAFVLLAGGGLIVWRVLAPAEVLATATEAYPPAVRRTPGVIGELVDPPLIVDGRIRVFATKRQVKADAPIDGRVEFTPRWSFRRWPQEVSGIVSLGTTVVTHWSDGQVVALDVRSGEIVWRQDGPAAGGFVDAATAVYEPPGLRTARTTVLVIGGDRVRALDVATGAVRWDGECRNENFATRGGQLVCGDVVRDGATGAEIRWPGGGPYTGLGCDLALSTCWGIRDAAGEGWQSVGAGLRRASGLDVPGSTAFLDLAFTDTAEGLTARSADNGDVQWRWDPQHPVRVIGAGQATVYALNGNRDIVLLDAVTGDVLVQVPINAEGDISAWQVAAGYVTLVHPEVVLLVSI